MKKQLLGFALVLSGFSATAQELDLETCLKMADTANLTIRNARLDMASNEKQIDSYMSARLPKLTFTGDYKYNAIIPGQVVPAAFFGGTPGTYSTVQFGVPINLSNTLQLTQILYNPQVNYGLRALEINSQIIETQHDLAVQEIKQQVAGTYFNLQALSKQHDFVVGNIASMDKLIKNMEAMEREGLIVGTEVDKLRINRLSLVNTRETLKASKEQLENLLKILIGIDPKQPITLASDVLVEKTILVDESTIEYPELKLLEAQKQLNIEERKGTNMAYLPNLAFYAAYNYNYNMKPADDFRTGIESAFLGLQLNWTLFDGLEKHNKQKVNAINAEKITNQQELAKQQLEMVTNNAKKQIEIQTGSLAISKEQLILAERVYKQTEAQFNEGTVSSNDLITADNGLQQAQTNVVAAYVQLRQAELAYLKSIGNIK
ncbi:MAG: TolC family protein [Fluviicola sp.]|nr:TolC family protein [Fluviicola sp.]